MNSGRGGKTKSRTAWLVTWMALIAMGFALATPPTTAANLPCASPGAQVQARVSQEAPAQVCSILPPADQDGMQSEARLAGPEMTDRAPDAATTEPADSSEYEFIHWEVHQKATGTTEYRGP